MCPAHRHTPSQQLSLLDSTSIIVGIIIGSGIYRSSPDIAAGAGRFASGMAAQWGLTSTSQENALALRRPSRSLAARRNDCPRGRDVLTPSLERRFLRPAGPTSICWKPLGGRWVLHSPGWSFGSSDPGNVGAMAFVMASYARPLLPRSGLADHTVELLLAVVAIGIITAINAVGLRTGKWTQNALTAAKVAGLVAIVVAAFLGPVATGDADRCRPNRGRRCRFR